jgi:hypothetical protein
MGCSVGPKQKQFQHVRMRSCCVSVLALPTMSPDRSAVLPLQVLQRAEHALLPVCSEGAVVHGQLPGRNSHRGSSAATAATAAEKLAAVRHCALHMYV